MQSHEVLRKALADLGVKSVAADMNLSTSLIYKWCQPKDHPQACGTDNPLDRLARLIELTGDDTPVRWLCRHADGFYVKNPEPSDQTDTAALRQTQAILAEFSLLLDAVSRSIGNDQRIDESEAQEIRGLWEELKSTTEAFVVTCERGRYSASRERGDSQGSDPPAVVQSRGADQDAHG